MVIGLLIIGALWLMIQCGKLMIRSISILARRWGLSEFILSFLLIAFATSLPELAIGINSALAGVPELSFGDILGTNIVNLTLIIGVTAVIGRSITVSDYAHFKSNRLYQLVIVLAPMILLLDGTLSRLDGGILLGLFIWNLFRFLNIDNAHERKVLRPHLVEHATMAVPEHPGVTWRYLGLLLVSAAGLGVATFIIVTAAETIAIALSIPTVLIGILIIATCSSLPELTVGVRSVLSGKGGVAIGDVFGAAAFNATLTLGLVALIKPIILPSITIVLLGIGFTLVSYFLVFYFLHTKQAISRGEGLLLLGMYGLFILAQIAVITHG